MTVGAGQDQVATARSKDHHVRRRWGAQTDDAKVRALEEVPVNLVRAQLCRESLTGNTGGCASSRAAVCVMGRDSRSGAIRAVTSSTGGTLAQRRKGACWHCHECAAAHEKPGVSTSPTACASASQKAYKICPMMSHVAHLCALHLTALKLQGGSSSAIAVLVCRVLCEPRTQDGQQFEALARLPRTAFLDLMQERVL